jgi:hypothetical protein
MYLCQITMCMGLIWTHVLSHIGILKRVGFYIPLTSLIPTVTRLTIANGDSSQRHWDSEKNKLKNETSFIRWSYPVPLSMRDSVQKELDEMLQIQITSIVIRCVWLTRKTVALDYARLPVQLMTVEKGIIQSPPPIDK